MDLPEHGDHQRYSEYLAEDGGRGPSKKEVVADDQFDPFDVDLLKGQLGNGEGAHPRPHRQNGPPFSQGSTTVARRCPPQ
jgi:hypothetical protein